MFLSSNQDHAFVTAELGKVLKVLNHAMCFFSGLFFFCLQVGAKGRRKKYSQGAEGGFLHQYKVPQNVSHQASH